MEGKKKMKMAEYVNGDDVNLVKVDLISDVYRQEAERQWIKAWENTVTDIVTKAIDFVEEALEFEAIHLQREAEAWIENYAREMKELERIQNLPGNWAVQRIPLFNAGIRNRPTFEQGPHLMDFDMRYRMVELFKNTMMNLLHKKTRRKRGKRRGRRQRRNNDG